MGSKGDIMISCRLFSILSRMTPNIQLLPELLVEYFLDIFRRLSTIVLIVFFLVIMVDVESSASINNGIFFLLALLLTLLLNFNCHFVTWSPSSAKQQITTTKKLFLVAGKNSQQTMTFQMILTLQ